MDELLNSEQTDDCESNPQACAADGQHEGRIQYDMDIDRMINEGLGGGNVTLHNGRIGETTVDTMLDQENA